MLVLGRKDGQGVVVAGACEVVVLRKSANRVAIGIKANDQTRIVRAELLDDFERRNFLAAASPEVSE